MTDRASHQRAMAFNNHEHIGKEKNNRAANTKVKPEVVVTDDGLGNVRSVSKALEAVGAKRNLTCDPRKVLSARAIVLPGVGVFSTGMHNLRSLRLLAAVRTAPGKKGNDSDFRG